MDGYRPSTYGDAFADVYDAWYGDLPGLDDAVRALAALAVDAPGALAAPGPVDAPGPLAAPGPVDAPGPLVAPGPRRAAQGPGQPPDGAGPGRSADAPGAGRPRLLELGCGTGRLALPLAALGLTVHALDASEAMLARLSAKPGAESLSLHVGDMARFDLHAVGPFSLVFVAFNSLFNLPSAEDQARCFATVADHLGPGGRFVVECFVPGDPPDGVVDAIDLHTITADRLVLRASRQDPARQTVAGQHVEITDHGVRLRPWHLRYTTVSQLDEMAALAGLAVASRAGDWTGAPFTDECQAHVTVYQQTGPGRPTDREPQS